MLGLRLGLAQTLPSCPSSPPPPPRQAVIDVKGGQLHVKMAPTVTSAKACWMMRGQASIALAFDVRAVTAGAGGDRARTHAR